MSSHRVASWVHSPDPVRPGPDLSAGWQVETHKHPNALQREFGAAGRQWSHWPGLGSEACSHGHVPQVRDGATLILSKVGVSQQPEDSQQDLPGERESLPLVPGGQRGPASTSCCQVGVLSSAAWDPGPILVPQRARPTGHALLEEENRVWHLVRPTDEVEDGKCKRGSVKEKERTKAITEIYLTRLLSVKVDGRPRLPMAGGWGGSGSAPAGTDSSSPAGHTAAVRGQLLPERAGAGAGGAAGSQVLLRLPG